MPSESSSGLSAPIQLVIRLLLTIGMIWLMSTFFDRYFFVAGGLPAFIILGSLLTIMNVIVRPILYVVTLPLHFLFSLLTLILVNSAFLWLTLRIVAELDPAVITLSIDKGLLGWSIASLLLGLSNWVFKELLKT